MLDPTLVLLLILLPTIICGLVGYLMYHIVTLHKTSVREVSDLAKFYAEILKAENLAEISMEKIRQEQNKAQLEFYAKATQETPQTNPYDPFDGAEVISPTTARNLDGIL